ncbi:unnamed protein product [Phaeothamnion confervicola]
MPLESTMICLDNSEWMRNGDYVPTRMEAQHDAANLVCGTKTQSNPESTVGVLTMAGKGPELLVSPTDDMGKILSSLHDVPLHGKTNLAAAVQIAQLALKHRRNKHGGQRIIIFVASPIEEDAKTLIKVGKLLKKNNVAVDVVSMGEIEENQEKLQEFVDAANSGDNCHLVVIPAGILPSDVLVSSPIIADEMGGMGGGMGGGAGGGTGAGGDFGGGEFGGVDPNMDPELAMALRVSMEEERARQEAAAKVAGDAAGAGAGETKAADAMETDDVTAAATAAVAAAAAGSGGSAAAARGTADMDADEELLLQQALTMSTQDMDADAGAGGMSGEEYEAMQEALRMSMAESDADAAPAAPASAPAVAPPQLTPAEGVSESKSSEGNAPAAASAASAVAPGGEFLNPDFARSLIEGLPGVDTSDPRIKAALEKLNKPAADKPDEKNGDSK